MKRTVFLIVLLALLVNAAPADAQHTGPWRIYLPAVGRACSGTGSSPLSQYEVPEGGLWVQVQFASPCSHVEWRVFYRSIEYPGGFWTYWGRVNGDGAFISVPRLQDLGGGNVRTNELLEFRDQTGHGYTITIIN